MNIGTAKKVTVMIRRIFNSTSSTQAINGQRPEKPAFSRHTASLPVCGVVGSGVDPRVLGDYLTSLKADPSLNIHSILVLKDGKLVCTARYGMHATDLPKQTFSQCKSVTSIAVGMLIDEGKLSLDERIVQIFPGETGAIARIALRDLKIRDLLTMTSTVLFNEAEAMCEDKWISCFLNSALKGDIGKTFNYNSLNTYMLAAVIVRKTGMSVTEYLKPRLFDPLGIGEIFWEKSPEGIEKGGWGLYIAPEDMAKIGIMLMNGGVYNGKRILSEEYIDEATRTQVQPPPEVSVNGYGYQIWTGENFFLFNGMFGQNLICFRDTGVIIVSNGGTGEMFQSSPFYTKTISTFSDPGSPVFSEGDADGALYLENVLKSIAFVPPAPICSGRTAKRGFFARLLGRNGETPEVIDPLLKYSGTELIADDMHAASAGLLPMMLQATQNTYTGGLTSVSFGEKDGALTVTFDESGEKHVFKAGYYRPETSDLDFSGEKYLVTAAGRTAYNEDGDEVLTIDVDFTETPCSKRLKFIFRGCGAVLAMTEKPGGDFILSSVLGVKEAFSGSILLRPILGRIEDDYLDFKTERAFSPKINMKYSDGQKRK